MFGLLSMLYTTGKLIDEGLRKDEGNRLRKKYQPIEDNIRRPLTEYLPPKTRDEFRIMCESISDDLQFVFGDDWRKKLDFPYLRDYEFYCNRINGRHMFTHPTNIAYNIWLAKKGYYDYIKFIEGYHTVYDDEKADYEDNRRLALRVCQAIEKNLQAAHPDLDLKLLSIPFRPYMLQWEHNLQKLGINDGERLW